jgi:hypothetical protein
MQQLVLTGKLQITVRCPSWIGIIKFLRFSKSGGRSTWARVTKCKALIMGGFGPHGFHGQRVLKCQIFIVVYM